MYSQRLVHRIVALSLPTILLLFFAYQDCQAQDTSGSNRIWLPLIQTGSTLNSDAAADPPDPSFSAAASVLQVSQAPSPAIWLDTGARFYGEVNVTLAVPGKILIAPYASPLGVRIITFDTGSNVAITHTLNLPELAPHDKTWINDMAIGHGNKVYAVTVTDGGPGNLIEFDYTNPGASARHLAVLMDSYPKLTVGAGDDQNVYIAACCNGHFYIYDPHSGSLEHIYDVLYDLNPLVSASLKHKQLLPDYLRLTELTTGSDGNIYGVASRIWIVPRGGAILWKFDTSTKKATVVWDLQLLATDEQLQRTGHEDHVIVSNPHDGKLYGAVGYQMKPHLWSYDPRTGQKKDFGHFDDIASDVWFMTANSSGTVFWQSVASGTLFSFDAAQPSKGIVKLGVANRGLVVGTDEQLYQSAPPTPISTSWQRADMIDVRQAILHSPLPLTPTVSLLDVMVQKTTITGTGIIYSWFDHDRTDGIVTDYHGVRARIPYSDHDGYDFHAVPSVVLDTSVISDSRYSSPVYPAAEGTVVAKGWDSTGFGYRVIISHTHGLFTLYGHLREGSIPNNIDVEVYVTRDQRIGDIGSTGRSTGPHLHFAVYRDTNNDGTCCGGDERFDPFGWWGMDESGQKSSDPYLVGKEALVSNQWLWVDLPTVQGELSAAGGTLVSQSGEVTLSVPPNIVAEATWVETREAPLARVFPDLTQGLRSLGVPVNFGTIQEPIATAGLVESPQVQSSATSQTMQLTIDYGQSDLLHLDADRAAVYWWDPSAGLSQELPTTLLPIEKRAVAQVSTFGAFDLQAPLICPSDIFEPWDDSPDYDLSPRLQVGGEPSDRWLDIPSDIDWMAFELEAGRKYQFLLDSQVAGLQVEHKLIGVNGVSEIQARAAASASALVDVEFDALDTGIYFASVLRLEGPFGCEVSYSVRVVDVTPPDNEPPIAHNQTVFTVEDTGIDILLTGTDPDGDPLSFSLVSYPNAGTLTGIAPYLTYVPSADFNGSDRFMFSVNDGTMESEPSVIDIAVEPANDEPRLGPILGLTADPIPVGTSVNASVELLDPDVGDSHVIEWNWGDNTENSIATPGMLNRTHVYASPGVYPIQIVATDNAGAKSRAIFQYVVIYDPTGGFVTGGGWIMSPPGACNPETCGPDITGKAVFGFQARYKKGANVPSGSTEFEFSAANLEFVSNEYQWLVVAGAKAQFKGQGTINGSGSFGFLLSAVDGALDGGSDRFRIKIWDKDTSATIYDNQVACQDLGVDDAAPPCTVIGGGSIVIHKQPGGKTDASVLDSGEDSGLNAASLYLPHIVQ